MRLECGFKRERKIRVAECLGQTVPNRSASVKKRKKKKKEEKKKNISPNVLVFTRWVTKVLVSDVDRNCLAGNRRKASGQTFSKRRTDDK